MITRWEEIAEKVAIRLNLPLDVVKHAIEDMAQKTLQHLIHPTTLETDLLGIGVLQTRMGKLKARIKAQPKIIERKMKYMARHLELGNMEKYEKLKKDIELIEQDKKVFEEILEQKQDMWDKFGRKNYIKDLLEGLDYKGIIPLKPKIILSDGTADYKQPGRKKGWSEGKSKKRTRKLTNPDKKCKLLG